MGIKRMLGQLQYDVRAGILNQKKKWFAVIAVIAAVYVAEFFVCGGFISPIEYVKLLFRGMNYISDERKFVLPNGIWLAINILLSIHIGMLVKDDLNIYGQIRLMKLGDKITWWISKLMLIVISIWVYYGLIICAACLCAEIPDICGFDYAHTEIVGDLSGLDILNAMLKMVFVSAAISAVQAIITLFDYRVGVAAVMIFLALTIYDKTHVFLGNYLMLGRSYVGIECGTGNMCAAAIIIICSVLAGIYAVKHYAVYIWR